MRIKYYRGTVTAYDEQHKWYKIKYDDGDGEDLNPKELCRCSSGRRMRRRMTRI